MRWTLRLLAIAALALSAPMANAQDDELVVTGRRAQEMAEQFAGVVAEPVASEGQYARWNDRLCPAVSGLAPDQAQILIDHIARRAHAVGVRAERSGCRQNLIIIFTTDSDAVAREVVTTRRDLMGYFSNEDIATAGRDRLEAFANTARAVRWWHVAYTVTPDGRTLTDTNTGVGRGTHDAVAASQGNTAAAATMGNGFRGIEAVRSEGSRFRRSTRQDIGFALIIVDTRRIEGLPSEAVADYLAMAALVQLDPDADLRAFPSILNLFADQQTGGPPAALSMTEWDQGYLQGLYSALREAASARQQRAAIVRRIVREVANN